MADCAHQGLFLKAEMCVPVMGVPPYKLHYHTLKHRVERLPFPSNTWDFAKISKFIEQRGEGEGKESSNNTLAFYFLLLILGAR